jgi:hypothetical protein
MTDLTCWGRYRPKLYHKQQTVFTTLIGSICSLAFIGLFITSTVILLIKTIGSPEIDCIQKTTSLSTATPAMDLISHSKLTDLNFFKEGLVFNLFKNNLTIEDC